MEKSSIESQQQKERLIPNRPRLRSIEDTLVLLESEEGPDGEKINWKDLYEKVGPWDSSLELSDNIREIVKEYLLSKFPAIKEKIDQIEDLPDDKLLKALANGWFEELGEEVSGKRKEVLLAVLANITKQIEARIYRKIIETADEQQLEKLGLNGSLRQLSQDVLDASVKSNPLFIRFLAYSQLAPKPPEEVRAGTPIGQDGKPHTWAELFPHETQFISKKLKAILETKPTWEEQPGAKDFEEYIKNLEVFFSTKNILETEELEDKTESSYARLVSSDFPILIAPPTGSYYKPPYFDPELKVLLRTPDTKSAEESFRPLQEALASELVSLNVSEFEDGMIKKVAKSFLSIGDYGAGLTFTAAAEADKVITLFLNEQRRHYDINLKKFLALIEVSDRAFADTSEQRIEEMSRDDTMLHEFSHSVYFEDTPEAKRLGPQPESVIAEVSAESIHRGLAKGMIEKGKLDFTLEQYTAVTIAMPLQVLEGSDSDDEYYKAGVYVLNKLFEKEIVVFDGQKIRITNQEQVLAQLKENAQAIIALYRNQEMTESKARKWISDNCTAGEKLQKLIDFIKGNKEEVVIKQSVIEVVKNISDSTLSGIFAIEKEVSTGAFSALEDNELKAVIEKPNTITVIIRDTSKNVLGFIVALPNNDVYEELHDDDHDFQDDPESLYVYDVAIGDKERSLANFLNLVRTLTKEARAKNFKVLSMHTRTSEGLSTILQKRYDAKLIRTLDNWQGYGEPFDYLEIEI